MKRASIVTVDVLKSSGGYNELRQQGAGLDYPFWLWREDGRSVECHNNRDFAGYMQAGYTFRDDPTAPKPKPRRKKKARAKRA